MVIHYIPQFETNRAFTLNALFRVCNQTLPNVNHLPQVKGKALQKAAALQTGRMLIQLLKNDAMYQLLLKHSNRLFIQVDRLFPQLPLLTKPPTELQHVWGPYVRKLCKMLAKLPRKRVIFGLSAEDEAGDETLLKALASRPELKHHAFVLTRPMAAEYYTGRKVVAVTKDKRGRRKSSTKTTSVTVELPRAMLQLSYEQARHLKKLDDTVFNIRLARKAHSFLVFD